MISKYVVEMIAPIIQEEKKKAVGLTIGEYEQLRQRDFGFRAAERLEESIGWFQLSKDIGDFLSKGRDKLQENLTETAENFRDAFRKAFTDSSNPVRDSVIRRYNLRAAGQHSSESSNMVNQLTTVSLPGYRLNYSYQPWALANMARQFFSAQPELLLSGQEQFVLPISKVPLLIRPPKGSFPLPKGRSDDMLSHLYAIDDGETVLKVTWMFGGKYLAAQYGWAVGLGIPAAAILGTMLLRNKYNQIINGSSGTKKRRKNDFEDTEKKMVILEKQIGNMYGSLDDNPDAYSELKKQVLKDVRELKNDVQIKEKHLEKNFNNGDLGRKGSELDAWDKILSRYGKNWEWLYKIENELNLSSEKLLADCSSVKGNRRQETLEVARRHCYELYKLGSSQEARDIAVKVLKTFAESGDSLTAGVDRALGGLGRIVFESGNALEKIKNNDGLHDGLIDLLEKIVDVDLDANITNELRGVVKDIKLNDKRIEAIDKITILKNYAAEVSSDSHNALFQAGVYEVALGKFDDAKATLEEILLLEDDAENPLEGLNQLQAESKTKIIKIDNHVSLKKAHSDVSKAIVLFNILTNALGSTDCNYFNFCVNLIGNVGSIISDVVLYQGYELPMYEQLTELNGLSENYFDTQKALRTVAVVMNAVTAADNINLLPSGVSRAYRNIIKPLYMTGTTGMSFYSTCVAQTCKFNISLLSGAVSLTRMAHHKLTVVPGMLVEDKLGIFFRTLEDTASWASIAAALVSIPAVPLALAAVTVSVVRYGLRDLNAEQANALVQNAELLIVQKKYTAAIGKLRQAESMDPDHRHAKTLKAYANCLELSTSENYDADALVESCKEYCEESKEQNAHIYMIRGSAYFKLNKYLEAREDFTKVLRISGPVAHVYELLASACLKLDNLEGFLDYNQLALNEYMRVIYQENLHIRPNEKYVDNIFNRVELIQKNFKEISEAIKQTFYKELDKKLVELKCVVDSIATDLNSQSKARQNQVFEKVSEGCVNLSRSKATLLAKVSANLKYVDTSTYYLMVAKVNSRFAYLQNKLLSNLSSPSINVTQKQEATEEKLPSLSSQDKKLQNAILGLNIKLAKILLSQGANPGMKDPVDGNSIWHDFVMEQSKYLNFYNNTQHLLDLGLDPLYINNKRFSPLTLAMVLSEATSTRLLTTFYNCILLRAVELGDLNLVKRAVLAGAEINFKDVSQRATMLHWAAHYGQLAVATWLIDHGAVLEARHFNNLNAGSTPTLWAAAKGRNEILKLFLKAGADPFLQNASGSTAYSVAYHNGFNEAVEAINEYAKNQKSPDIVALNNPADALRVAITGGKFDQFKKLMFGDLRNFINNNASPFYNLLETGGYRLIHYAARRGDPNMIRTLVLQGHADVNAQNSRNPALHTAIYHCRKNPELAAIMVKTLLDLGANPNATNIFGRTPLKSAVEYLGNNAGRVIDYLFQAGALRRVGACDAYKYAQSQKLDSDIVNRLQYGDRRYLRVYSECVRPGMTLFFNKWDERRVNDEKENIKSHSKKTTVSSSKFFNQKTSSTDPDSDSSSDNESQKKVWPEVTLYGDNDIDSVVNAWIDALEGQTHVNSTLLRKQFSSNSHEALGPENPLYHVAVLACEETGHKFKHVNKTHELKPDAGRRDDRRDVFTDLMPKLKENSESHAKILFPLNISQVHWILVEIIIHRSVDQYQVEIYGHDSMKDGGKISSKDYHSLKADISKRIKDEHPLAGFTFSQKESPYNCTQTDGNSCGVIVADNLIKRIQGTSLRMDTPYPKNALALRRQQLDVVLQSTRITDRDKETFFNRNMVNSNLYNWSDFASSEINGCLKSAKTC